MYAIFLDLDFCTKKFIEIMLTKKKIIAIFTANYFFEELIKLLKEEGLEIERKKNFIG